MGKGFIAGSTRADTRCSKCLTNTFSNATDGNPCHNHTVVAASCPVGDYLYLGTNVDDDALCTKNISTVVDGGDGGTTNTTNTPTSTGDGGSGGGDSGVSSPCSEKCGDMNVGGCTAVIPADCNTASCVAAAVKNSSKCSTCFDCLAIPRFNCSSMCPPGKCEDTCRPVCIVATGAAHTADGITPTEIAATKLDSKACKECTLKYSCTKCHNCRTQQLKNPAQQLQSPCETMCPDTCNDACTEQCRGDKLFSAACRTCQKSVDLSVGQTDGISNIGGNAGSSSRMSSCVACLTCRQMQTITVQQAQQALYGNADAAQLTSELQARIAQGDTAATLRYVDTMLALIQNVEKKKNYSPSSNASALTSIRITIVEGIRAAISIPGKAPTTQVMRSHAATLLNKTVFFLSGTASPPKLVASIARAANAVINSAAQAGKGTSLLPATARNLLEALSSALILSSDDTNPTDKSATKRAIEDTVRATGGRSTNSTLRFVARSVAFSRYPPSAGSSNVPFTTYDAALLSRENTGSTLAPPARLTLSSSDETTMSTAVLQYGQKENPIADAVSSDVVWVSSTAQTENGTRRLNITTKNQSSILNVQVSIPESPANNETNDCQAKFRTTRQDTRTETGLSEEQSNLPGICTKWSRVNTTSEDLERENCTLARTPYRNGSTNLWSVECTCNITAEDLESGVHVAIALYTFDNVGRIFLTKLGTLAKASLAPVVVACSPIVLGLLALLGWLIYLKLYKLSFQAETDNTNRNNVSAPSSQVSSGHRLQPQRFSSNNRRNEFARRRQQQHIADGRSRVRRLFHVASAVETLELTDDESSNTTCGGLLLRHVWQRHTWAVMKESHELLAVFLSKRRNGLGAVERLAIFVSYTELQILVVTVTFDAYACNDMMTFFEGGEETRASWVFARLFLILFSNLLTIPVEFLVRAVFDAEVARRSARGQMKCSCCGSCANTNSCSIGNWFKVVPWFIAALSSLSCALLIILATSAKTGAGSPGEILPCRCQLTGTDEQMKDWEGMVFLQLVTWLCASRPFTIFLIAALLRIKERKRRERPRSVVSGGSSPGTTVTVLGGGDGYGLEIQATPKRVEMRSNPLHTSEQRGGGKGNSLGGKAGSAVQTSIILRRAQSSQSFGEEKKDDVDASDASAGTVVRGRNQDVAIPRSVELCVSDGASATPPPGSNVGRLAVYKSSRLKVKRSVKKRETSEREERSPTTPAASVVASDVNLDNDFHTKSDPQINKALKTLRARINSSESSSSGGQGMSFMVAKLKAAPLKVPRMRDDSSANKSDDEDNDFHTKSDPQINKALKTLRARINSSESSSSGGQGMSFMVAKMKAPPLKVPRMQDDSSENKSDDEVCGFGKNQPNLDIDVDCGLDGESDGKLDGNRSRTVVDWNTHVDDETGQEHYEHRKSGKAVSHR